MISRRPLKALIFDLGDVLFTWSASTDTCIPAKTLRDILSSDIWKNLDRGCISRQECYTQAADRFALPTTEIHKAFTQARNSVQPNSEIIAVIRDFKNSCNSGVKIIGMSNISKEDYAALELEIAQWNIFDHVFTSGCVGMRKPDSGFYNYVLNQLDLQPQEAMFIDDKAENVNMALDLGSNGIVFRENQLVIDALKRVERDPFERGWRYLLDNVEHSRSITDSGIAVDDNFARLLIQDIMPSQDLVQARWDQKRTWNFFNGTFFEPDDNLIPTDFACEGKGTPVLVPGNHFPDDLDTTSLALMVLQPNQEVLTSVLDEMLKYVHKDGRFQTYFDWSKPRTDEVVSANVMACFYYFGRGHQLAPTLEMVHEILLDGAFAQGTRYYPRPDCCLFFFGRLLRSSDDTRLHNKLGSILRARVKERVGQDGSAIELAMRIITCYELGVECDIDVEALLAWQQADGGWPASWMYRYGSTGVQLGNRSVTTALAIKAITYV